MEKDIYEAPAATLDNAEISGSELASRWSRLAAALIDGLTVMTVTVPLMYFTGGFSGLAEGGQPSYSYLFLVTIVGIVAFLLIHGRSLARDGQTWGKRWLGIRIVTVDEAHADIKTLSMRYGFFWLVPQIPIIGALINLVNMGFIFTPSKRCLHDHVAGTKVIRAH